MFSFAFLTRGDAHPTLSALHDTLLAALTPLGAKLSFDGCVIMVRLGVLRICQFSRFYAFDRVEIRSDAEDYVFEVFYTYFVMIVGLNTLLLPVVVWAAGGSGTSALVMVLASLCSGIAAFTIYRKLAVDRLTSLARGQIT